MILVLVSAVPALGAVICFGIEPGRRTVFTTILLLFGVIFVAALFAAGMIGNRTIVRKINRLIRVSKEWASGNLQARAGMKTDKGELGRLARSFDEMAAELERKEHGRRHAEEKYQEIFDNAAMGIYRADLQGVLMEANPAMANMLGYESPSELLAGGAPDVQVYVNPEERMALLRLLEEKGTAKGFEAQWHRKDGSKAWVLINSRTIFAETREPIGYECMVEDITENKNLEERLFQAEKMEAIGQLAGGVAHDFNNILTVLVGYSNLLQLKTDADSPLREYIDQMLAATEKASALTQSLLVFSRKQQIDRSPHDLNAGSA